MYQKNVVKKTLLIGEGEKKRYIFIKDFNTLMYDHGLHCRRKCFCCYYCKVLGQQKN